MCLYVCPYFPSHLLNVYYNFILHLNIFSPQEKVKISMNIDLKDYMNIQCRKKKNKNTQCDFVPAGRVVEGQDPPNKTIFTKTKICVIAESSSS